MNTEEKKACGPRTDPSKCSGCNGTGIGNCICGGKGTVEAERDGYKVAALERLLKPPVTCAGCGSTTHRTAGCPDNPDAKKVWKGMVSRIQRHKAKCDYHEPEMNAILAADAELTRLSAIVARVENAEEMAKVIKDSHHTHWGNPHVTPVTHAARAVRDYAMGVNDADITKRR